MQVRPGLRLGLAVLSFWPFMPLFARAPLYGRLLIELMLDRRVPTTRKAIVGVALAYVASPVDLVPDFIPIISRLDDFAALVVSLDLLLDAQRRRAEAESAYYRSLVDYNRGIMNVHYRKGSLLDYDGVYLAEGAWPAKAYFDAMRQARKRDAALFIDYGYTRPNVVSQGPVQQGCSTDGQGSREIFGAPAPDQVMPDGAVPEESLPAPGSTPAATPPTNNSTYNFDPTRQKGKAYHPLSAVDAISSVGPGAKRNRLGQGVQG